LVDALTMPATSATHRYVEAVLHAIARDEVSGRRPPRLTEPGLATWERFRGRMGLWHFAQLVLEDAAVLLPVPFDVSQLQTDDIDMSGIDAAWVATWLAELTTIDLSASGADYILTQAGRLDVNSRLARSDLHQVKPHQKVLELPSTGGQLAYHLVTTQPDLYLQSNFHVACGSWQELALAGILALECHAPDAQFTAFDPNLSFARDDVRRQNWDFVVGATTDKGGRFGFERLHELFPSAKVILV
jgi:hypothetical protein